MKAFAITMIVYLMMSQIGYATKLNLLRNGSRLPVPTEGVLAFALFIELCLMAWGVVVVLN